MKRRNFVIFGIIFIILLSTVVFAIDVWNAGYRVNHGDVKTIRYNSVTGPTAQVTNTHSSNDYFIPTKTSAEWLSFKNHKPSGISISSSISSGCEPVVDASWSSWSTCSGVSCTDRCGTLSGGTQTRTCSGASCGGSTTCTGDSSQPCSVNCGSCPSGEGCSSASYCVDCITSCSSVSGTMPCGTSFTHINPSGCSPSSLSCTGTYCSSGRTCSVGCCADCSCASDTCTGSYCSNGCGGNCAGTKYCCTPTCESYCYNHVCYAGAGTCC